MKILRLNEPLTEEMIEEINSSSPVLLEIKNTVGLTPYLLEQLDDSVQIRLYGAQDEKQDSKYGVSEVFENSTYTKEQLISVIGVLEEIESSIQPNWTDLEKALYTYITLESVLGYRDDKEFADRPEYNGIYSIVKGAGTSKGIATLYKEAMDRQGVLCRYLSRGNNNAWNEVKINGVYYPLDLSMDVLFHNDVKNEGAIGICNFLTDENFYDNPNHFINGEKRKSLAFPREEMEKSLAVISDRPNNQTVEIRQTPTLPLKSKAFQDILEGNELTRETAEKVKKIKITLDNPADVEALKEDIREIGKFYPEVLRDIELENAGATHSNMQEVVDQIFDARRDLEGTPEAQEGFTITISSNNPDDFSLDFSNAPKIQVNDALPLENRPTQKIVLKNIGNSPITAPDIRDKVSSNIGEIELNGFDMQGFSLGGSSVEHVIVSGANTTNLGGIDPSAVTAKFTVNAIPQAEFDDFMANVYPTATHMFELRIINQNLHDRRIFTELTRNPNVVRFIINNSRLNDLDGLESLNGRIAYLDLCENDLSVLDLDRLYRFKENNEFLDYDFRYNVNIQNAMASAGPISRETLDYMADYFYGIGYMNPRPTAQKDILNMLLISCHTVPYYIKDARAMRDDLRLRMNPMMLERDDEIDTVDFNASHLQGGTLLLTVSQIERLLASGKIVPQDVRIKINDATDLDSAKARDLMTRMSAKGMNLTGVQVISDKHDSERSILTPYSMSDYIYIRDTLDMLVEGINPSDSDLDKFAVIYQRIIDSISYNFDAITKNDRASAMRYAQLINSSRSMLDGLKDGTCVCVGYADILKNALALVGIDSKIMRGLADRNDRDSAHDWNQVLLDDGTGHKRWYYADATADRNKGRNRAGRPNPYACTLIGENNANITKRSFWTQNINPSSSTDYDRIRVAQAFARARGMSFDATSRRQDVIPILPDPTARVVLDDDRLRDEFIRRRDDMYAKFYGDRDYQMEFEERMSRYKSHEVDRSDGGFNYRTIEDYPERDEDEKFLLLDKYRECLERLTRYDEGRGDASVYSSDPATRDAEIARDREYIETNNHAFDQHKNTQKDLATMGKFGERVPYIPRQAGVLRNVGRVILNAGILARNIVAPVYRVVGRFVAQPIHRLITRGRDATPYRNNIFHRMVARRNYFADKANTDNPGHPFRNAIAARFNSVFRAAEGNEAVLRAGAKDIADNIKAQESESAIIRTLDTTIHEFEVQIHDLETALSANPYAANKNQVQAAIAYKKLKLESYRRARDNASQTIGSAQTDAISDKEHAVASKEVNTLRTTIIKGVMTGLAVKYVGPKIHDWMLSRGKSTVTTKVPTKEWVDKKEWVPATYRKEPIYDTVLDTDSSVRNLIGLNKGQSVTGYYSVHGGPRLPKTYTISGNERVTGIFKTIGDGGTGLSDKVGLTAPRFTDRVFAEGMLDGKGYLDQGVSLDELLRAVDSGATKVSDLEGVYVSLNDQYWTDLPTLVSKLLRKVKVGEDTIKLTDGHFIGGWVDGTKEITEEVMDPVIQGIADASVVAGRAAVGADAVVNVAENVRNTHTNVRSNKPSRRDYSFNDPELSNVPHSRREYRDNR